MTDIPYAQILSFPFQASLTNGQLEAAQQEKGSNGATTLVVDYQELRLTEEPQLIERGNLPAELLEGYYHPWARPDSHHWLQLRWFANHQ